MDEDVEYKGYTIRNFEDGTFDIEHFGELIDGGFKSYDECTKVIDEFE